jgi:hypothetical protein
LLIASTVAMAAPSSADQQNGRPFREADPPCFDNLNRYVDCGNGTVTGTVTDTVTGLIWLGV